MAKPTLANSRKRPQLFAEIVWSFAPNSQKPQSEFRVFPSGESLYPWRIAASAANQIVSRHKSLSFALKKYIWLNGQREEGSHK